MLQNYKLIGDFLEYEITQCQLKNIFAIIYFIMGQIFNFSAYNCVVYHYKLKSTKT